MAREPQCAWCGDEIEVADAHEDRGVRYHAVCAARRARILAGLPLLRAVAPH